MKPIVISASMQKMLIIYFICVLLCYMAYLFIDEVYLEDFLMYIIVPFGFLFFEYQVSVIFEISGNNFRYKRHKDEEYSKWYEKSDISGVQNNIFRNLIVLTDGTELFLEPFIFQSRDMKFLMSFFTVDSDHQ